MLVIKFGGSSVRDAERIRAAAHIAAGHHAHGPLAVVVSAMAGVTDGLLRCADAALASDGEWRPGLTDIEERHRAAYTALTGAVPPAFDALWQALVADITALSYVGPRPGSLAALDEAACFSGWGERLMVGIFAAALSAYGTPAEALDAAPVLLAGRERGERGEGGDNTPARPSVLATRAWLGPRLSSPFLRGAMPVLPGYIARDAAGRSATLGRNGSDHSAAVIAAALGAHAIYLYSDVAGVYSADPRVVPEARLLPVLTYTEAAEVAALGARVLHPRTVEPLARWRIPLYLRDVRQPDGPGTDVLPPGANAYERTGGPLSWVIATRPLPSDASSLPFELSHSDLVEVSATLIGPVRWQSISGTPLAAVVAAVLARGEPVAALSVSGGRLHVAIPAAASVPTQRQLHATLVALRASEEHAAGALEPQPQTTAVG
jgi:bifunctional aspartokinase / homoserine dehydrogenase 1